MTGAMVIINTMTHITRQGDTSPQGRRIDAKPATVHRTIKADLRVPIYLG